MIDWNKYFDHIFVISRCSNFDRRKWIDLEFNRVGINQFQYWYSFDDNIKLDNNKFHEDKRKNIVYAHYSLIKTCYQLGYENILICEDDICFLNDNEQIYNILEKFNYVKPKINVYLFDHVGYLLYDLNIWFYADCYYLDRKGMEYLIYCIENFHLNHDNFWFTKLRYPNNYNEFTCNWTLDENSYRIELTEPILPIQIEISDPHLCIQKWNSDFPYNFLDENLYNKY